MTEGKVWGTTAEVYRDAGIAVHFLKIKAGGRSSEHRHTFKENVFVVLTGEIEVRIWRAEKLVDRTILRAGTELVVPAGVWHDFLAREDSTVIEIYRAGLRDPDIERRTQGECRPEAIRSGD
jgi:quercetin dioxygenase-like cupin family protein